MKSDKIHKDQGSHSSVCNSRFRTLEDLALRSHSSFTYRKYKHLSHSSLSSSQLIFVICIIEILRIPALESHNSLPYIFWQKLFKGRRQQLTSHKPCCLRSVFFRSLRTYRVLLGSGPVIPDAHKRRYYSTTALATLLVHGVSNVLTLPQPRFKM